MTFKKTLIFITLLINSLLLISCSTLEPNTKTDETVMEPVLSQTDIYNDYRVTIPEDIKLRLKPATFLLKKTYGTNFEHPRTQNDSNAPTHVSLDVPAYLEVANSGVDIDEIVFDDPITGLYNQIDIKGIYFVEDSFILDEYSPSLLYFNEWVIGETPSAVYRREYKGGMLIKTVQGYDCVLTSIAPVYASKYTSFVTSALIRISTNAVIEVIISIDIHDLDLIPYILQSVRCNTTIWLSF